MVSPLLGARPIYGSAPHLLELLGDPAGPLTARRKTHVTVRRKPALQDVAVFINDLEGLAGDTAAPTKEHHAVFTCLAGVVEEVLDARAVHDFRRQQHILSIICTPICLPP